MMRHVGCVILALLMTACATRSQPKFQGPIPTTVEAIAAAIHKDAQLSDRAPDGKSRSNLAADAMSDANACMVMQPQAAACLYGRAIALGLDARAHPMLATEDLNGMIEALAAAEGADPNYDQAGPSRVRALVLMRAPDWPLGPGDINEGLAAAQRAVAQKPLYPPNILALAEALARKGDAAGARENYIRARDLALALPASAERDGWVSEANRALQ